MNILILCDLRDPARPLESVGAVDYHRTVVPGINLAIQYGHNVTFSKYLPDKCEFDVVIKSRTISNNGRDAEDLQTIRRWAVPLVIDIDDYWELPKEHILHEHWYANNTDKRTLFAIENADMVWASIFTLAKKIKPHNAHIEVIKNAIDKTQPQFDNRVMQPRSGGIRLGWAGSITHTHDFPVVREGFSRLAQSGLDYSMNLCGYAPQDQNNVMVFAQYRLMCASHNVNLWNALPVVSYANFYRQIDVAIAPLAANEFNACKSELKLLEAANFGIPVVASNCFPYYQNEFKDAVLFASRETWFTHLKTLISSAKMRKHYGAELQNVCDKHYNIKAETEKRHKALCDLTGKK